jgi:hypothetical protein
VPPEPTSRHLPGRPDRGRQDREQGQGLPPPAHPYRGLGSDGPEGMLTAEHRPRLQSVARGSQRHPRALPRHPAAPPRRPDTRGAYGCCICDLWCPSVLCGPLRLSDPGGLGLRGDFCAPWCTQSTRKPESTQENGVVALVRHAPGLSRTQWPLASKQAWPGRRPGAVTPQGSTTIVNAALLATHGDHASQGHQIGPNNVVDSGYEVDPVHPGPPDQPQSPDQPRSFAVIVLTWVRIVLVVLMVQRKDAGRRAGRRHALEQHARGLPGRAFAGPCGCGRLRRGSREVSRCSGGRRLRR